MLKNVTLLNNIHTVQKEAPPFWLSLKRLQWKFKTHQNDKHWKNICMSTNSPAAKLQSMRHKKMVGDGHIYS